MKERIHDNSNGLDYILAGDYYIPDLRLSEEENRKIGRWGRMHRDYLREYRSTLYNELLLSGRLWTYLADLNEQVEERLDLIIRQMEEAEDITEELKRKDVLKWIQSMNSIRSRAEEIVVHDLVYA